MNHILHGTYSQWYTNIDNKSKPVIQKIKDYKLQITRPDIH